MAPIVLSDVTKSYRGAEVVRDVSFEVPDGAICALTGPVGSGKSTLLRLIAAREAPTSGVVEVGDAVSQSWRIGRPEVVAFADPADLKARRNVYDTMRDGFFARGLKGSEAQEATLAAADRMGLGALMARRLDQISTGERALALFGRSLGEDVRAILLDDPFAGLDSGRRLALRRELRRLRDEGATVVIASNSWTDVLALADVIVVLNRGRVVAAGPARDLHDAPPTARAASLLGDPPMNVLPVRANQTGLSLEDGTHLGGASVMTGATFARLGVRPEHLFVAGEGSPPAAAILPVMVEAIERAGHESFVHGHVGPFAMVGRISGAVEPPASGPLRLGALRENLHMFDAETGERL